MELERGNGFTRVEWLVVAGIVLVMGLLAAIAVNTARSTQRDAVRIANVRQLQSALEDFYNQENHYPSGDGLALGGPGSTCLSDNGYQSDCSGAEQVFLRVISPTLDSGLKGLVRCGNPIRNALCYSVRLDGDAYQIEFELERAIDRADLKKGVNCASPAGMEGGSC